MLTVKCLVFGLHVIAQQNREGEHVALCVSQILFIFTFSLTIFFKTHGSTRVKSLDSEVVGLFPQQQFCNDLWWVGWS